MSRDTAFCIHAPQEQIKKNTWLSHYSLENKEDIALFFYATGAYHVNGKAECVRKVAYGTDHRYMALLHDEPVPPSFLKDARGSGADVAICGKHLWFDVQKVSRLTTPWFGDDWARCYDYFAKKAEDAGLTVAHLNCTPWQAPVTGDAAIQFCDPSADTVDVLVPCSWDVVPLKFWSSITTMDMTKVARMLVVSDDDICAARNRLVEGTLQGASGRSIFFDVDMWFPQDTINRLYARDKDIVGGAYYQRQAPFYPHLYENLGNHGEPRTKRIVELKPFMEVDSLGTGCLMVKREVYEEMSNKPYRLRYIPIDVLVGEDINFCYEAKKLGYKIFADCTLDIGHIGVILVNPAHAGTMKSSWRPML